jgi:hypothetical protein
MKSFFVFFFEQQLKLPPPPGQLNNQYRQQSARLARILTASEINAQVDIYELTFYRHP